jgi:hypothetical protein
LTARESSDPGVVAKGDPHEPSIVSANHRPGLTDLLRLVPLLALAGTGGFALAACGGGGGSSALSTRTGATATRPTSTATQSEPTRTRTLALPTTTASVTETTTAAVTTTTTVVTTTAPGPTTTRPAIIVTTETQSTSVPVPIVPSTTTTATSSSSSTPWGWIILGIGLAAALVIGIVVWRGRRAGAAAWSDRAGDLNRRSLLALDDVLAQGSVVTGQIQALASEAQTLEARAPDNRSKAAAAQVRARLDDLARTLESDRALRLASPPPSTEQLSYSSALIRQQVEQLQGVLRPPGTGGQPT